MTAPFVLDRALILDRLGEDEEIFLLLIDLFLQDVDNNALVLGEALLLNKADVLMREAHTIKSLLATLSDDAGAAKAAAIEQQAKLGNLDGLLPAVAAVQRRLFEVARVLRAQTGFAG